MCRHARRTRLPGAMAAGLGLLAVLCSVPAMAAGSGFSVVRAERYVAFEPPQIIPGDDYQTVKAGGSYVFRCESGGDGARGVSWRMPADAHDDLLHRVVLHHRSEDRGQPKAKRPGRVHVAELTISKLRYTDTGTFTCTYNGTADISSIDNSSHVHLYVEDDAHLMKQSGVDFLQAVQSASLVLPCQPTHPDVNVTLLREGSGPVNMDNKVISFDPKVGFRISPVTLEQHAGLFKCVAKARNGRTQNYTVNLSVLMNTNYVPPPMINKEAARLVRVGDDFTLVCSVTVDYGVMVELRWTTPSARAVSEGRLHAQEQAARNLSIGGTHIKTVEQALTIRKATMDDQGAYVCNVTDHSSNSQTKSEFVRISQKAEPYFLVTSEGYQTIEKAEDDKTPVQWVVEIDSDVVPKVAWYGPDGQEIVPKEADDRSQQDFEVRSTLRRKKSRTMLKINKIRIESAGFYTIRVDNGTAVKEERFELLLRAKPKVQASVVNPRSLYHFGHEYTVKCSAKGLPRPRISWLFKPCKSYDECSNDESRTFPSIAESDHSAHSKDAVLKMVARQSGEIVCQACNVPGCTYQKIPFFLTDVEDGFAVDGPSKVVEGDHIKLKCSASAYNYSVDTMRWYKHEMNGLIELPPHDNAKGDLSEKPLYLITKTNTEWSFTQVLSFPNVSLIDRGRYLCTVRPRVSGHSALSLNSSPKSSYRRHSSASGGNAFYSDASALVGGTHAEDDSGRLELALDLSVLPLERPVITATNLEGKSTVVDDPALGLELECRVTGRPPPRIRWTLNGRPVNMTRNTTRVQTDSNGQRLLVSYVSERDEGLYACVADNRLGQVSATQMVQLKASALRDEMFANISLPVIVAVAVAIVVVVLLLVLAKICYERRRVGRWKEPPTPPTPRLTQFELPQNREEALDCDDDDCRMTLTSTMMRDGSISPHNSAYGFAGGSIVGVGPMHCHCHGYACHSQMGTLRGSTHMQQQHGGLGGLGGGLFPKCSICDFSAQTMPLNRMMTLKRYDHHKERVASPSLDEPLAPRLSAEF